MSDHVAGLFRQQMGRSLRHIVLFALFCRQYSPVWLAAVLIGGCAILFAVGNIWTHHLFEVVYARSCYWSLLMTPCGLGLAVWLLNRYFSGTVSSGIPQARASLHTDAKQIRERLFTLKTVFGQILLTLIGIFSGATFGYEGPIVLVGAAIAYRLNRVTAQQYEDHAQGLILAGAAAGIAAAFNAPLTGIVFAIEEMKHTFDRRTLSIILLSVIIAGLTAISWEGNHHYLGITAGVLNLRQGWIAMPVCGIAGGLTGGLTAKIILSLAARLPGPLHLLRQRYPVHFAIGCGLVIAVIGLSAHGTTFGTGYWRTREMILQNGGDLTAYGPLKWLTMLISFISGAPGGTLAPALAVGAGLGLDLASLMPNLPHTSIILLSMAAFFAGMTQAPITGFIIMLEISDASNMAIPLMTTTFIAAALSRRLSHQALYSALSDLWLNKTRQGGHQKAQIDHHPHDT